MSESVDEALTVIEHARQARLALEAAEAQAWLRFALGYDSGRGDHRTRYAAAGTPDVDAYLALELAAALRRSEPSIRFQLIELLDLAYRLPQLWQLVCDARLPVWVGRRLAAHTHHLSPDQAAGVDTALAPVAERLSTTRLETYCHALVAQADPDTAAAARERAKAWRGIDITPIENPAHGASRLTGLLDTADGHALDTALDHIAGILARHGNPDPEQARRARALGILATPALALHLLQTDHTQPALDHTTGTDTTSSGDTTPDTAPDVPAAGCTGHTCGTITVPPDKLLPKAHLVVHLSDTTLTTGHGLCRIEGIGPVLAQHLSDLLGHRRVRVHPVYNPDQIIPADSYEIPAPIRQAVALRHPYEVFPYSHRPTTNCDLDHTQPWQPDGEPGQTRPDNLGPLTRRPHRAKTHTLWRLDQPTPGTFTWTTPLGRTYTIGPDGLTTTGPPRQPPGTHPGPQPPAAPDNLAA